MSESSLLSHVKYEDLSQSSSENNKDQNKDVYGKLDYLSLNEPSITTLKPAWRRFSEMLFDFSLIIGSILFAVFTSYSKPLDGTRADEPNPPMPFTGDTYISMAKIVGGILYQPFFALVVGNLMRNLVRYRMERGTRIETLEQLKASSSFAGFLTMSFKVRNTRLLPLQILLLCIWSCYFAGELSTSSVLYREEQYGESYTPFEVRYVQDRSGSSLASGADNKAARLKAKSLFLAAITASSNIKNSGTDLAGNVKIPVYEHLDGYSDTWDEDSSYRHGKWLYPDSNPEFVKYSSFIGVQVFGRPVNESVAIGFPLGGTYVNMTCTRKEINNTHLADLTAQFLSQFRDTNLDRYQCQNDSATKPIIVLGPYDSNNDESLWKLGFKTQIFNISNSEDKLHDGIISKILLDIYMKDIQTKISCIARQRFISAKVHCKGQICNVKEVSAGLHLTHFGGLSIDTDITTYRSFDKCTQVYTFLRFFIDALYPFRSSGSHISLLEGFIRRPEAPLSYFLTENSNTTHDLFDDLSDTDISLRISQIFNTAYRASLDSMTSPDLQTIAALANNRNEDVKASLLKPVKAEKYGMVGYYGIRYHFHVIAVYCWIAMISCAWVAMVLGYFIRGPDIEGYISTMTRDNPNCPLPTDASAMDGPQRSRWLGEARVILKDIGKEHGHLSLTWIKKDKLLEIDEISLKKKYY